MAKQKLIVFTMLVFVFSSNVVAQDPVIDTSKIQRKARWVRKKYAKYPTTLANRLVRNYNDDASKVIAISYWISKNIKYDVKALQSGSYFRKTSNEVLKSKKAMCGEYAILFNEMCESVGVYSERVGGYTKKFDLFPEDHLYRAEHAWSVVDIQNKWELMDLTWAAGYLKPKKQYVEKILWLLLTRPYKIKWKFKKQYNEDWLYVPPEQMITSHFPEIDPFQLLNEPVKIEAFIANDISLDGRYSIQKNAPELEKFCNKNTVNRWRYVGVHGHELNPHNHRIKGISFYRIADELVERYYDPEHDKLRLNIDQMNQLIHYWEESVEMISASIDDNNHEYEVYNARSEKWEDDLNLYNKEHKELISSRIKGNSKEIRTISRIESKNESISDQVENTQKRISKPNISRTRRPSEKKSNATLAEIMIARADSLLLVNDGLIDQKDSLMNVYDETLQQKLLALETSLHLEHKKNKNNLRRKVNGRLMNFSWIHFGDYFIEKPWYHAPLKHADSLNNVRIDSYLTSMYDHQKEWSTVMKAYYKNYKEILKFIKKAKKSSEVDLSEDELFDQNKTLCANEWSRYQNQVANYFTVGKSLERQLEDEIKCLEKSKELLEKDEEIEFIRHNTYRNYRRSIREVENGRMKYVLGELKRINKLIDKTLGYPIDEPVEVISLNDDNIEEILMAHNKYREELNLPPLKWSDELEKSAKIWAQNLGESGMELKHSDDSYGENLAMNAGYISTPAHVVSLWASEKEYFDFTEKKCNTNLGDCGHYTQIIWKNTKSVGCALVQKGNKQIWVCKYDPPGNVNIDIGAPPY